MITVLIYILIAILGSASYFIGARQILQGRYAPSIFSRFIWLLLTINSSAGIILSNGSKSSILLAIISLLGNIAIFGVSLKNGYKVFGRLEIFCVLLLVISGLVWILFDAPLVNLSISLFAHFVGALPTYKKVWLDPRSESFGFWSLFFMSSLLSIFVAGNVSLSTIIFPIYFAIFDGSITLLTLRNKGRINRKPLA